MCDGYVEGSVCIGCAMGMLRGVCALGYSGGVEMYVCIAMGVRWGI